MTTPLTTEERAALLCMGYRALDPEELQWGKPLGYTLLQVNLQSGEWVHYFFGRMNNKLAVWDSQPLERGDSMLKFLKQCETWHIGRHLESEKSFEFLTTDQQAELML